MRAILSEEVFKKLAYDIVSGTLPPGQRLEEQTIAKQFNVSRTPVREALRQLSGAGLVEAEPCKGVTVAKIDVDQLADMFDTMGELDGLCAKLSAQRMNALERKKLEVLLAKSKEAANANDLVDYAALNEQFHDLIYQGAHSVSLRQITMTFRQRLSPFRVPIFFKISERMYSSLREHEEIVLAIAAGDDVRACEAMKSHVASTNLNVVEYFTTQRGGPEDALSKVALQPA